MYFFTLLFSIFCTVLLIRDWCINPAENTREREKKNLKCLFSFWMSMCACVWPTSLNLFFSPPLLSSPREREIKSNCSNMRSDFVLLIVIVDLFIRSFFSFVLAVVHYPIYPYSCLWALSLTYFSFLAVKFRRL